MEEKSSVFRDHGEEISATFNIIADVFPHAIKFIIFQLLAGFRG
jgi:hypothetical protein